MRMSNPLTVLRTNRTTALCHVRQQYEYTKLHTYWSCCAHVSSPLRTNPLYLSAEREVRLDATAAEDRHHVSEGRAAVSRLHRICLRELDDAWRGGRGGG